MGRRKVFGPRIFAISGIYGMYTKFMRLWNLLDLKPESDIVVFMGDYIDRGTENLAVINFLLTPSNIHRIILKSERERLFLNHYGKYGLFPSFSKWVVSGGDTTLAELNLLDDDNVLPIIKFFDRCQYQETIIHEGIKYDFMCGDCLTSREIKPANYKNIKVLSTLDTSITRLDEPRPWKPKRDWLVWRPNTAAFLRDNVVSAVELISGEIYQP